MWHNRLGFAWTVLSPSTPARYSNTPGLRRCSARARTAPSSPPSSSVSRCSRCAAPRSRRGPQALLELTGWAERGYDLAITPDGPRGPCYVVQEGVMSLAQVTGLPLSAGLLSPEMEIRAEELGPVPGATAVLPLRRVFAKPVHVPRSASDEEREALAPAVGTDAEGNYPRLTRRYQGASGPKPGDNARSDASPTSRSPWCRESQSGR